jgi:hypothetical protein
MFLLFLERLKVLAVTRITMIVFWDVALCILISIYRRFTGAYCLHRQSDDCHRPMMEAVKVKLSCYRSAGAKEEWRYSSYSFLTSALDGG